jgi:hypothetical protein
VGESLWAIAVAGALIAVLIQAGRLALRPLRAHYHDRLESACFGFGAGIGLAGYAVLAVGLVGGFGAKGFVPVLLVLVAMAAAETVLQRRRTVDWQRQPRTARFLYPAMAVLGLLLLISAVAPPADLDYDSLAYHLAMPRLYLDQGRIFYVNFCHQSNFPFTMEMVCGLCLFLQGAAAARLLHLATFMFTGLALFALGRRLYSPVAGAYAALLYMTVPLAQWEGATAYVDLPNAFFSLLAVYGVLVWLGRKDRGWLLQGGVMLGLALGTKMNSWALWGILVALVLYVAVRERLGWARAARHALLHLGLVAAVIAAPWAIKSQVWTGNPVYPFFYSVFGGRNWNRAAEAQYREAQLKMGMGRSPQALGALPVRLTYEGERFYDAPKVFASPGPLFLAFLPLLLLWRPLPRELKVTLVCCLGLLVFWSFMMQQLRYLFPFLACAALAGGAAAARARQRTFGLQIAVGFMTGLFFALLLVLSLAVNSLQFPVAVGLERRVDYLRKAFPPYAAMEYLNHLPGKVKVATYGEARGFYLRQPYLFGEQGHHQLIHYAELDTPDKLVRGLGRLGITHLLVNRSFTPDIPSGNSALGKAGAEALRLQMIERVFERNGVVVYRIVS